MNEKMTKIVEELEARINEKLPKDFIKEVEKYCERKVMLIGKSDSYLPILFESELQAQYQGRKITEYTLSIMKGCELNVSRV